MLPRLFLNLNPLPFGLLSSRTVCEHYTWSSSISFHPHFPQSEPCTLFGYRFWLTRVPRTGSLSHGCHPVETESRPAVSPMTPVTVLELVQIPPALLH